MAHDSQGDFPLTTPFREKVVELILSRPNPGRQPARMAVRHLERAWMIREIDPEMAVFRTITAEEEAATALIHALRRLNYPGAKRLYPRNHKHKAAVVPFFGLVRDWFAHLGFPDTQLFVHPNGVEERLNVRIEVTLPDGSKRYAIPNNPLEFEVRELGTSVPANLSRVIQDLANPTNAQAVRSRIAERANLRNRVLYASDEGLPNVELQAEKYLHAHGSEVFAVLAAYLLVDQYHAHQIFAAQLLRAFTDLADTLGPVRKGKGA